MAAAQVNGITKRRLTTLLGTVQAGDTPEKQDAAWNKIVAAFDFDGRKGALDNPLLYELCQALKGRLDGVGIAYKEKDVDRWFADLDIDRFWFNVIGPMIDDLEERVVGDLGLEDPDN